MICPRTGNNFLVSVALVFVFVLVPVRSMLGVFGCCWDLLVALVLFVLLLLLALLMLVVLVLVVLVLVALVLAGLW